MKWLPILGYLAFASLLAPALVAAPVPHAAGRAAPSLLKKKKKTKKTAAAHNRRGPTQTVPDSDRTTEIQTALSRGGYYQGEPTGKWDSDTVAAVEKFQSANGLDSKGKLDAPTLQKLGLGSEIAGVSAPKPAAYPPPSASLLVAPTASAAASVAPRVSSPGASPSGPSSAATSPAISSPQPAPAN